MRDLGEPDRHPFQAGRRRRLEQGMGERRTAGRGTNRQRQDLDEARHVVARLRRQPRHDPALSEVLASPLGEQRGLAVAGRRLHQDDRVIAQALVVGLQARTGDLVPRHARRRDLQQKVVGDASEGGGAIGHGIPRRLADARERSAAVGTSDGMVRAPGGAAIVRACPPAAGRASAGIGCIGSTQFDPRPSCTAICSFPSMTPTSRSGSSATPSPWRARSARASPSSTPSPTLRARCAATPRCCA